MFKANTNISAIEKWFMFSGSDMGLTILIVAPAWTKYTVSNRLFSSKWKGIYTNRITRSMVHCSHSDERAHEYDLVFQF